MLQLLIPYIAWSVIRVLLTPPYSLLGVANIFLHPDGVFWFLWVLFYISLIFYFVDWIAEKIRLKQEFTIIATCLLLAGIMAAIEFRLFGFQFISYYFLFYVVGYFIHKYQSVIIT